MRTKAGPGLRLGAAQLAASAPSPLLAPAGKDDGVKSDLVTTDGLKSLSSDKKLVVKTAKGLAVEADDDTGESAGRSCCGCRNNAGKQRREAACRGLQTRWSPAGRQCARHFWSGERMQCAALSS